MKSYEKVSFVNVSSREEIPSPANVNTYKYPTLNLQVDGVNISYFESFPTIVLKRAKVLRD